MSSIAGGIHSIATSIITDIQKRLLPGLVSHESVGEVRVLRILTLLLGVAATALACVVERLGRVRCRMVETPYKDANECLQQGLGRAAFRDVIAHDYFGLNVNIIWDVVENKIPEIVRATSALLKRLREDTP